MQVCVKLNMSCTVTGVRLSSHLASDRFQATCRWINHEADSSDLVLDIQRVIFDECQGSSREASETIASECNVTFELYCMTIVDMEMIMESKLCSYLIIKCHNRWHSIK